MPHACVCVCARGWWCGAYGGTERSGVPSGTAIGGGVHTVGVTRLSSSCKCIRMCDIYFRAYLHGDTHTHARTQSSRTGLGGWVRTGKYVYSPGRIRPFISRHTLLPCFGVYFANIYKLTSIILRGAVVRMCACAYALASACLIRTCQIMRMRLPRGAFNFLSACWVVNGGGGERWCAQPLRT